MPLPEPLAGVTVIQLALLEAVHPHPVPEVAETVIEPLPPEAASEPVIGDTVNAQVADWVSNTVCPATMTEPDRSAPVFAVAVSVTVAVPLPLVALVVTHAVLVDTVQVQPVGATTVTGVVPPVSATDAVVGVTA